MMSSTIANQKGALLTNARPQTADGERICRDSIADVNAALKDVAQRFKLLVKTSVQA